MIKQNTFKCKMFLAFIFAFACLVGYGQDSSAIKKQPANPVSNAIGVNYFKIEVGMHILDCPVLPARLKEKVSALKGMKDYTVDAKSQSILFNIPEGVTTAEQIKNMAVNCAFPSTSINVLMDHKPFANK